MRPEVAEAALRFLNYADDLGKLADSDRPHVLVATWPGGQGPAMGPFPDLFAAEAGKLEWEASLNVDLGADEEPIVVVVMPLFEPGT